MYGFGLKGIYKASYIYLALPLFIFLATWLDYAWSIIFTALFGISFYKAYTHVMVEDNNSWQLGAGNACIILLLAAIWCFFAGIGYFYYQSFDYHFRNAVFRDLINYEWPVFYDKADTPMVYYMAFWLFPALLGKLTAFIIHNNYLNFYIANIYLFLYSLFGVWLIFAHLCAALKVYTKKQTLGFILLFMLFSGADIIGDKFFLVGKSPFAYHLEWWAQFIQYSSFTTGIFWVFNQFIPVALLTLLVYNEHNIRHFGFLIVVSLFISPYPTAGVGIFMVAYALYKFFNAHNKKEFICNEIFSVANLIGVFLLLPIIVLYFITNSEGMQKLYYVFDYATPLILIIFMLLEFLFYSLILFPRYRHNVFYVTAVLSLTLIPFFRLDEQNNFCMRSSIPGLIILAVFVLKYIKEATAEKKHYIGASLLSILLIIGMATPLTEFYRGIYFTHHEGKIALVADNIRTLNQSFVRMPIFGWDANHQYTAKTYRTDIFWQYFSKKHRPNGR